jgi:hypothetical protein
VAGASIDVVAVPVPADATATAPGAPSVATTVVRWGVATPIAVPSL